MNTIAIENAVQEFREQQLVAANNRINATAPRDQSAEMIDREMAVVDARVAAYRDSLGVPDDQQVDETPTPAVVLPGTKN